MHVIVLTIPLGCCCLQLNATKGFLEWLRDTLLTEEQVQDQPANQRQRPVNY